MLEALGHEDGRYQRLNSDCSLLPRSPILPNRPRVQPGRHDEENDGGAYLRGLSHATRVAVGTRPRQTGECRTDSVARRRCAVPAKCEHAEDQGVNLRGKESA